VSAVVLALAGAAAAPPEAGVLIDFTPIKVGDADLTLRVTFGDRVAEWSYPHEGYTSDAEDFAFCVHHNLGRCGIRAEIVDKTKVRVLEYKKDGKIYPAVKGTAASKTLPAKQLPKITNPPQA
jgi:hypothetical protein